MKRFLALLSAFIAGGLTISLASLAPYTAHAFGGWGGGWGSHIN